jgi:hypothetical protein
MQMNRIVALSLAGLTIAGASLAARAEDVRCSMTFTMKSWSAFYKTSSGAGTIACANGQTAKVRLIAKGGGITAGKSTIDDGHGEFTGVRGIDQLLGAYASAEATAGAVKAAKGQVMTKGEVSVALSGTGRGWELGVAFGKLTISRR